MLRPKLRENAMRVAIAVLACTVLALGGCAVVGAVGTVASAAGSAVATTVDVAGDVVGGVGDAIGSAAGAVSGGHDHDAK
jgi:hypothetical protein